MILVTEEEIRANWPDTLVWFDSRALRRLPICSKLSGTDLASSSTEDWANIKVKKNQLNKSFHFQQNFLEATKSFQQNFMLPWVCRILLQLRSGHHHTQNFLIPSNTRIPLPVWVNLFCSDRGFLCYNNSTLFFNFHSFQFHSSPSKSPQPHQCNACNNYHMLETTLISLNLEFQPGSILTIAMHCYDCRLF